MEHAKLTNQKETIEFLRKKYPLCFFTDKLVKPLKIGIFQDLANDLEAEDIISKRLLRTSLRHYTSSWRYLASVKAGVPRIDLNGADGELVELQHAEHAALQLKESKAKAAQMREAKEPAKPSQASKHKGYVEKSVDGQSPKAAVSKRTKAFPKRTKSGATKPATIKPQAAKPISVITEAELVVGAQALVKLGKEPMPVVITNLDKDGVAVQLKSGMTVKVQKAQLYKVG